MSAIETYLQYIASKVWARDVRTAIVNAIRQCYDDVHNPTLNTEALQAAIQAKIDAGQMAALTIGDRTITAAKLALGVIPTPDATLSQSGVPADAKKTGDEITAIKADLENLELGLSDEVKEALLACFNNVAWASEDAPNYISTLQSALYPEVYPKLVATYTPGTHVVYMDDSLDSLKPYITVMYYETEQSPGIEIGQNDYILSGNLAEGTCVLTVAYGNMTTRVSITNVIDYYNLFVWKYSDGITRIVDQKNPSHIVGDNNFRYLTLGSSPSRDFIGSTKGNYPLHSYENYSTIITPYVYPIPIPQTAQKVKIDFTMASGQIQSDYVFQAVIGKLSEYDNEMVYEKSTSSAELASGGIFTMFSDGVDVHNNRFLFVPIKSLSSIMPTVTDFTITFLNE